MEVTLFAAVKSPDADTGNIGKFVLLLSKPRAEENALRLHYVISFLTQKHFTIELTLLKPPSLQSTVNFPLLMIAHPLINPFIS